jgi:hypothetical protein
MKRSGIPVEWRSYESELARDWLESLSFASEREKVEHLRRIGEVMASMYGGKIPEKFAAVENSLVELGKAFISGELREDVPPVDECGDDIAEVWHEELGMSKAAFQRHMTGIGVMVYEVMSIKPLTLEEYFITLTQIAERLFVRRARDPQELAGAFRKWQTKERATQKQGRDPRQVLSRRRDT